jgi:beta-N-acetylhexosaminidase
MTAHVIFSAVDPKNPATTSGKVIEEVIRREIGFDGLLISDDTSMKALSGDFPTKAASILAAGCDLVLHCNGVFEEMAGIASRTTGLEGKALERANRALSVIGKGDAAKEADIREEFATYFEALVA